MVEIMCTNYQCPSSMMCYRFVALPSEDDQDYAHYQPKQGNDKCDEFILAHSMTKEKK